MSPFPLPGKTRWFWLRDMVGQPVGDLWKAHPGLVLLWDVLPKTAYACVLIPEGSRELPSQSEGVARLLLPSGDVLVARRREREPEGPWALYVELARDEEHRRRLEALHAQDGADELRAWAEQQAIETEAERRTCRAFASLLATSANRSIAAVCGAEI